MPKTKKAKKAKKSQKGGGVYEFTGDFRKDLETIENYNNIIRNELINHDDQNKTYYAANNQIIINVVVGNTIIPGPISLVQAFNAFKEDEKNTLNQVNNYFKEDQWQSFFINGNINKLFIDVMKTFEMFVNAGDNYHIQSDQVFLMQDGKYNFNNLISVQDQIEKNYNYIREKLTIFVTYDQITKYERPLVLQAMDLKKKAIKTQIPGVVKQWSEINTYLEDTLYPVNDAWFSENISKIYVICNILLDYYLDNHNIANNKLELSKRIIDYVDNIITYQLERTFLRLKSLEYSAQELAINPTLNNTTTLRTQAIVIGNYEVFKQYRKLWLTVKKKKLERIKIIENSYKKATQKQIQQYQQKHQQQQQQPLSLPEYQALSRLTTPQKQQQHYSRLSTPQKQQQNYSRLSTPQKQQQNYSRLTTPQIQQQQYSRLSTPQIQQQKEEPTVYEKITDSELYESLGLTESDIKYITGLKDKKVENLKEIVKDTLLTFSIDGKTEDLQKLKSEHLKKNKLVEIIDRLIQSKQNV